MRSIIEAVIFTLENIEVHGKENLSGLLGCINALESVLGEEEPKETSEEEQE